MALTRAFLGYLKVDASATTIDVTVNSTGYTHVAVFVKHETAPTTITLSDNKGSPAFTQLTKVNHTNNDLSGQLQWVKIGTPGATHTITATFGVSVPFRHIGVWGILADSGQIAMDVEAVAQASAATTHDAGTLTTTAATVSVMAVGPYNTVTYTPGAGWTEDVDDGLYGESRADASAGTLDPVCTSSAALSTVLCSASFLEIGGGGGGSPIMGHMILVNA